MQPPFAAPPSEGRTARVWWGLGLGALAAVLCCGVGLTSIIGLGVTEVAATNERAHATVENYLQAVGAARYSEAYDMLCEELRSRQSRQAFTDRVSGGTKVREYELFQTQAGTSEWTVPANVTYTDGTRTDVTYRVAWDANAGDMRFCGVTR